METWLAVAIVIIGLACTYWIICTNREHEKRLKGCQQCGDFLARVLASSIVSVCPDDVQAIWKQFTEDRVWIKKKQFKIDFNSIDRDYVIVGKLMRLRQIVSELDSYSSGKIQNRLSFDLEVKVQGAYGLIEKLDPKLIERHFGKKFDEYLRGLEKKSCKVMHRAYLEVIERSAGNMIKNYNCACDYAELAGLDISEEVASTNIVRLLETLRTLIDQRSLGAVESTPEPATVS